MEKRVAELEAECSGLEIRLRVLHEQLEVSRKNGKPSVERQQELDATKTLLAQNRAQLALLHSQTESRGRLQYRGYFAPGSGGLLFAAPEEQVTGEVARKRQDIFLSLDRPISLELRDATIRQAARTMSEVSKVQINVDPAVKDERRLTVVAQSVALKSVLVEVARQTELLIVPDTDGVLLQPMPALEVNGKPTKFVAPNAPWSRAWGRLPEVSQLLSGPQAFQMQFGGPLAEFAVSGAPGLRQSVGGVSMTGLGSDMFVVAHPSTAESEPGVVLTVYRLEGGQLRVISSTLHPIGKAKATVTTPSRPIPPMPTPSAPRLPADPKR